MKTGQICMESYQVVISLEIFFLFIAYWLINVLTRVSLPVFLRNSKTFLTLPGTLMKPEFGQETFLKEPQ